MSPTEWVDLPELAPVIWPSTRTGREKIVLQLSSIGNHHHKLIHLYHCDCGMESLLYSFMGLWELQTYATDTVGPMQVLGYFLFMWWLLLIDCD